MPLHVPYVSGNMVSSIMVSALLARNWELWGCGPPHRSMCLPRPGKASPAVAGTPTHAASQVHREHICDVNSTLSQDHGAVLGLSPQDEHKRTLLENAMSRPPESTLSKLTVLPGYGRPDPCDSPGHVKPLTSVCSNRPIRWSKMT